MEQLPIQPKKQGDKKSTWEWRLGGNGQTLKKGGRQHRGLRTPCQLWKVFPKLKIQRDRKKSHTAKN